MTESKDGSARKSLPAAALWVSLAAAVVAVFLIAWFGRPLVHAEGITPQVESAWLPGFAGVVASVKPAVISVVAAQERSQAGDTAAGEDGAPSHQNLQDPAGDERNSRQAIISMGSGFFISADGYAVTNNHVVDHASSVEVRTDGGQTYPAEI